MLNFNPTEYASLPAGETAAGKCPQCGKDKFYVTRKPEGFAFICFRASCDYKGYYDELSPAPGRKAPKMSRVFVGNTSLVLPEDIAYFQDRFAADIGDTPAQAAYWVKRTDDGRYVFPIWGPRDEDRGLVVRRATWRCDVHKPPISDDYGPEYPKSLTYLNEGCTRAAWYHSLREDVVVVVEDQVSAMTIASQGPTAMAILGTHFNRDHVADLLRFKNCERVIFAFDPDATTKAIKTCMRYGGVLPNAGVAILEQDPKDAPSIPDLMKELGL
ncbi:MAG: hypothetical protein ACYSTZ_10175 [Planctomycetota bacterium]|jgi:hypothetical protein